jgi:hypothetical protein
MYSVKKLNSVSLRKKSIVIPTVAINGGLGNQLFQWFFAHTIMVDSKFKIDKIFDDFDYTGQLHYQLGELESQCHHVVNPGGSKYLSKAHKFFYTSLNRGWNYSIFRYLLRQIGYLRESPKKSDAQNSSVFGDRNLRYAFGYFQNTDSIRDTIIVDNELLKYIDLFSDNLLKRLNLLKGKYDVIHVRKYPIKTMRTVDIGNLSIEYYRNWIREVDAKNLVVLCKEYNEAERLLDTHPGAIILDNQTLNPWEAIALMSKARKTLSSNSTLGWWGALLCAKNLGDAYLPSDWSYWGNVDTHKLFFEGCKVFPSSWDLSEHVDQTCIDPRTGNMI